MYTVAACWEAHPTATDRSRDSDVGGTHTHTHREAVHAINVTHTHTYTTHDRKGSVGTGRPGQRTCPLLLQHVPAVAVEVVVSAEHQAAAPGEGHRRDAADDVVVRVHADLLVGADVKQAAGGVVRPGGEGVAVWKVL